MPWAEVGYTETGWAADDEALPYAHDYYWVDGYTVADEWSLVDDPADSWVAV